MKTELTLTKKDIGLLLQDKVLPLEVEVRLERDRPRCKHNMKPTPKCPSV